MLIGVLALQGDFVRHSRQLRMHEASVLEVRKPHQLAAVDALIIPGGESTTLLKLLDPAMRTEIIDRATRGMPIFATCAGLVLLAETVLHPAQESLGLLNVTVTRNAYGSQVDSFIEPALDWNIPDPPDIQEGVFIRAPRIENIGTDVLPVLSHKGQPVCVQQKNILAAAFHPELSSGKSPLFAYFLGQLSDICNEQRRLRFSALDSPGSLTYHFSTYVPESSRELQISKPKESNK